MAGEAISREHRALLHVPDTDEIGQPTHVTDRSVVDPCRCWQTTPLRLSRLRRLLPGTGPEKTAIARSVQTPAGLNIRRRRHLSGTIRIIWQRCCLSPRAAGTTKKAARRATFWCACLRRPFGPWGWPAPAQAASASCRSLPLRKD